jgi:uncharacterized membrane protein YgcG
MGTNKNVVVSFSIAILLLLSLLLLLTYNSKCNQSHNTTGPVMRSSQNSYNVENYSKGPEPFYFEKFTQNESFAQEEQFNNKKLTLEQIEKYKKGTYPEQMNLERYYKRSLGLDTTVLARHKKSPHSKFTDYKEGMNVEEGFNDYNEGMTVEQMADLASVQMSNEVSPQWSARANQQTQNSPMMSSQGQGPTGSFNGNSSFQPVSNMGGGGMGGGGGAGGSNQQGMQSCFPRDRLSADDLLPKDAADSKWAQINPSGGGNISDQNYLTAGYHVGVNTVGQSLRNANLQLRSEIPNPQDAVGPWMISTIEPDLRQNTLEIGSSISY